MTQTRLKVSFHPDTLAAIGPNESLSSRVAVMLDRYRSMCRELMPTFTQNEWLAILHANIGTFEDASHIEDASPEILLRNLRERWDVAERFGVDTAELVVRLKALNRAELIAVQEACTRYWYCRRQDPELGSAGAIREAWIKVDE